MNDARLLIDTLRIASPGDPGVLASRWAAADVDALLRLVDYEGAILWLHRRLKMLGITLEAPLRERVTGAAKLAAAKLLRLDDEAARTLRFLTDAGIPVVPLKGAALRRISARVPYLDARTPVDVDLLCRIEDAQRAYDLLVGAGYAPHREAPPDGHHLPTLYGPLAIGVELHLTTVHHVPPAEAWRRATHEGVTIRHQGRSIPIPSDTELLWHAMSHSVLTSEEAARFGTRLRFFLDAAAFLASDAAVIDWDRLRARIDTPECPRPGLVRAWFATAAELAGRPLPQGVLGKGPVEPINLERMLSWRHVLLSQTGGTKRWVEKLFEEGARGELKLPVSPPYHTASRYAQTRNLFASRCARAWWNVRAV